MVIIATARVNANDWDRAFGSYHSDSFGFHVSLSGSLGHMGYSGCPRETAQEPWPEKSVTSGDPSTESWVPACPWQVPGLPRIPLTFPHHLPSQGAPSQGSVGLDLGKDLLLLDPAILKPYGDLAL